ncbi:hypothetical protein D3C77_665940 [compost metagenome]
MSFSGELVITDPALFIDRVEGCMWSLRVRLNEYEWTSFASVCTHVDECQGTKLKLTTGEYIWFFTLKTFNFA